MKLAIFAFISASTSVLAAGNYRVNRDTQPQHWSMQNQHVPMVQEAQTLYEASAEQVQVTESRPKRAVQIDPKLNIGELMRVPKNAMLEAQLKNAGMAGFKPRSLILKEAIGGSRD